MEGFVQLEAQALYLEPIKWLCGWVVTTCDILFPTHKFRTENRFFKLSFAIFANKVVIVSNFKLVKGMSEVD